MKEPRAQALPALSLTLAIQALASASVIAPTAIAPVMTQQLSLPLTAVGVYISLVYFGAMLSTVLGSHVIVRHGAIRTSQMALGLSAIGLALLASGSVAAAALGALLIGLGYGPITPASSQILARTTPAQRMGLVFSIKQTGVPLGGVLAGLVMPPLTLATHWGTALLCVGAASLLCAALAQTLRASLDADRSSAPARPGLRALLAPVQMIWRSPPLRTMALCSLVFSLVQACLTAYLVSYLTQQLGWTLVAAGAALSVSQGAGVVGRVLWGWAADRGTGARRMLMALCGAMSVSGLLMPLYGPATAPALVLAALVVYGGTAIGWNGVYLAAVARLAPPGQAGPATGGTLAYTYLGVVFGPPLFGLIASLPWGHGAAFAATALPLALCFYALRPRGTGA